MKAPKFLMPVLLALVTGAFSACTALTGGADPYGDAWEAVVHSGEWKASLDGPEPPAVPQDQVHYAIPSYNPLEAAPVTPEFQQRYPALVSRAYFRLIAEALDADRRVARTYQELYREAHRQENESNPELQKEFEAAGRRYVAHREMLEGLRSWKAFNEYGSDDLDFFMQEQLPEAYRMYERGVTEEKLLDYLMRRLADLYHKQHGGIHPVTLLPG